MVYCVECGKGLPEGAKFCLYCGKQVENLGKREKRREQEYVGKIYKCPNCGTIINSDEELCSGCGWKITRKASFFVQKFSEEISEIEKNRGKENAMIKFFGVESKTDSLLLNKIRNFVIPNDIDEIAEFMLLAEANIDVNLSRNNWVNKANGDGNSIARSISNAWVAKMQQAYHLAELNFSMDEKFCKISDMYMNKMKELKIKM